MQIPSAGRSFGGGIRPGDPLFENFPEDDPRHNALAPFFEVMKKFQILEEEYPTLSIEWRAEDGKWISWPPPGRAIRKGEECPSSPGSDLHIETSAGEAARRLLESPESWFNPTRDPWLDINNKEPSERWLYAIREFWLNAGEEAEEAGADMDEFAKATEADGYCHTRNAHPVGERVWRKMVRSKQSLGDSLQELELSVLNQIGEYEEPAGWVQTGCITHAFRACAYFCGVLAALRARALEKLAGAGSIASAPKRFPEADIRAAIDELTLRVNDIAEFPPASKKDAPSEVPQPDSSAKEKWFISCKDQGLEKPLRKDFERLAVHAAEVALEVRFRTTSEAVDAWLDILQKESAYAYKWKITCLALASAEHCKELRIRSLRAAKSAEAATLAEIEQQFRALAVGPPRTELVALLLDSNEPQESQQSPEAPIGKTRGPVDQIETPPLEVPRVDAEGRLDRFIRSHPGTTYADIKYSADVYTTEFQKWRKGKLKSTSVMSERIEDFLSGKTPLRKKPRKPKAD